MNNRWTLIAMIALVLMGSGFALADDWDAPAPDKDGSIALAEKLSALAHQALRAPKVVTASAWEQSTALRRATTRLDPTQPRFQRALAENLLSTNDPDGAMEILKIYSRLVPDDQGALVQQIDLQLTQYQSADDKIKYLHYILKLETLPKPVRSAAAARCAELLEGRSEGREALKMVDTALALNPLNLAAMRLKYEMTGVAAVPLDRVNQLLGMLRANPADPTVASRLAMQLADLGLVNPSLMWFKFANLLYTRTGIAPDSLFARGAAAEALLADKASEAAALMKEYLDIYPGDADAWFIRLSTAKYQLSQGKIDQAAYSALIRTASIGLTNLLQNIRKAAGDPAATTRPMDSDTDSTLADLTGDPARLSKSARPDVADAYISAATSLAWLDLYYRHDVAAADQLINVLAKLVLPNDVQLLRLRGWRAYVSGDSEGAIGPLQMAAKGGDPLAKLGLVMIDRDKPTKHDQAVADAKTLIDAHPSLMIGATLWAELNGMGVSIDPSPQSDVVADLVNRVPGEFMQLVTNPESFYTIRAEPTRAIYDFGEPVLIHVLVKNFSNTDLAIGDDCALHPDIWFDAFLRGQVQESFIGVAVGRIDQRLVLGAGQSFSTVVRVDEDQLFLLFGQSPSQDLLVNMTVVSNPAGVQQGNANQPGKVEVGPCGLSVQLTRMLERASTPISTPDARNKLADRLDDGDGGTRFRTLEVMASYVLILRRVGNADEKACAEDFADTIRKTQNDHEAPVRAWAKYLEAVISSAAAKPAVIQGMAHDPEWTTRLMAVTAAPLSRETAPSVLQPLCADPDPIVREYAKGISEALAAATTQPASEPQPGAAPPMHELEAPEPPAPPPSPPAQ